MIVTGMPIAPGAARYVVYFVPMDTSVPTPPVVPPRSLDWLPRWELIVLFIGDIIALLLFAFWGEARHGLLAGEPIRVVVNTAAPFMLAWLAVGAAAGTYRGTALFPARRVLLRTLAAAVIAGPLGVAFWSLGRGRWPAEPVFWLVTTAVSSLMLVVWRLIWSRVRRAWWPELP